MVNSLIWFRQDLRLADNPALTAACERIRREGGTLRALYIATPSQWRSHDVAPMQLDFIERHLHSLAQELARLGVVFELVHLNDFAAVPAFMADYVRRHDISQVFAAREGEWNERLRDAQAVQSLAGLGVSLSLFEQDCLCPPGTVLNAQGDMYRVFTPFSRRWREALLSRPLRPLPTPAVMGPPLMPASPLVLDVVKRASDRWPAGEAAAAGMLADFVAHKAADYRQLRDFPALEGTSSLSPYLAIGVLSPRQCLAALLGEFPEALVEDTSPGRSWLNELCWRDFYRHLLVAFPRLSRGANFKSAANKIRWRNDEQDFAAWCRGMTGYPIIDAAMRQLNQTGWMHNRLRMLTASFLTKHLLIDWRWGERYFRQQLIDGDLAANNGGWQWSAGTGCDAQPYFRIFNPITQSQKFDPHGHFIHSFLPELTQVELKALHQACPQPRTGTEGQFYPAAIVEHGFARARALERLSPLKAKAQAL